jgi:hypothetical protein
MNTKNYIINIKIAYYQILMKFFFGCLFSFHFFFFILSFFLFLFFFVLLHTFVAVDPFFFSYFL